jgi:hypothetical protein
MGFDESMLTSILGLGPAMGLDWQDVMFIESMKRDYKAGLKEAGIEGIEKTAPGVGRGSFAAYAYFQYGVPVFTTNLWTAPEAEKGQSQEARARPQPVPGPSEDAPGPSAVQSTETASGGRGFVAWTPFRHPTLGDIEIGGKAPFQNTPPSPESLEKTISFHTDFYIDLMNRMARLEVLDVKTVFLGGDVYKVTVRIVNSGRFPTSTAQGRRAKRSWPIRVQLHPSAGQALFSGRPIVTLPFLNGNGDIRTLEWTVRGPKRSVLRITVASPKTNPLNLSIALDDKES